MENWKKEKYKKFKYTEHKNIFNFKQANMTTCEKNCTRIRCSCIYTVGRSIYLLCHILLSVSLHLPVCPHISALLALDGFTWNLLLETLIKICRESKAYIEKIYGEIWHEHILEYNGIRLLG